MTEYLWKINYRHYEFLNQTLSIKTFCFTVNVFISKVPGLEKRPNCFTWLSNAKPQNGIQKRKKDFDIFCSSFSTSYSLFSFMYSYMNFEHVKACTITLLLLNGTVCWHFCLIKCYMWLDVATFHHKIFMSCFEYDVDVSKINFVFTISIFYKTILFVPQSTSVLQNTISLIPNNTVFYILKNQTENVYHIHQLKLQTKIVRKIIEEYAL